MLVEDRQVDPVEAGMEAGAPDDAGEGDFLAVFRHRLAVPDPSDLADAPNPGVIELPWPRPDQRHALTVHL